MPGRPSRENVGSIIETDVRRQKEFIDRWSARVPSVTNARNRKMLELILGEMKEHLRVLEQAKEGRSDLLGRHSDGKVLRGEVLPGPTTELASRCVAIALGSNLGDRQAHLDTRSPRCSWTSKTSRSRRSWKHSHSALVRSTARI